MPCAASAVSSVLAAGRARPDRSQPLIKSSGSARTLSGSVGGLSFSMHQTPDLQTATISTTAQTEAQEKSENKINWMCNILQVCFCHTSTVWIMCFSLPFPFYLVLPSSAPSPACWGVRCCLHKSLHLSSGLRETFARWCCLTRCTRIERKTE